MEEEMRPKDKYTMFDSKAKGYRKGIHSESSVCISWFQEKRKEQMVGSDVADIRAFTELPKWTRISQRINPPGF